MPDTISIAAAGAPPNCQLGVLLRTVTGLLCGAEILYIRSEPITKLFGKIHVYKIDICDHELVLLVLLGLDE